MRIVYPNCAWCRASDNYCQICGKDRMNMSMPREIEKGKRPGAPPGGAKKGK